jgi:2-polyprenyl-6-methoxyphenol hydroxylase-like FAD-dependent oxidoreductase
VRSSLGFQIEFHDYKSGYLMVIVDRPRELEWGRHYLGKDTFLGLFSLPNDLMRAAIEIRSEDLKGWLSLDNEQLKKRMVELAPVLAGSNIRNVGGFYHVIRRHSERYVKDGVALVGDAAHTTHPQLGQGMSMVFFDVSVLSKLILSNPERSFSEEELMEYESRARPYDAEIMRNAHELTEALEAIGRDPNALDSYRTVLDRVGFRRENAASAGEEVRKTKREEEK